jgi:hypothetical protein
MCVPTHSFLALQRSRWHCMIDFASLLQYQWEAQPEPADLSAIGADTVAFELARQTSLALRSSNTVCRRYVTMSALHAPRISPFTLQGFPYSRLFLQRRRRTLHIQGCESSARLPPRISRPIVTRGKSKTLKGKLGTEYGIKPTFSLCPIRQLDSYRVRTTPSCRRHSFDQFHSLLFETIILVRSSRARRKVWPPTHTSMRPWCSPGRA